LFGAWLMHVRLKSDAGPLHSFWCRMRLAFLLKVASMVYVFLVSDLWELEGGILFARHALYLAALLCLGWALAALPTRPGKLGHRSSGYLDGLMISLALFIIAWGTFIKRLVDTHANGGGSYVFTLVYPILAVTLLALWFFQESRRVVGLSNGERRLIGAGFLSITLFYGIFAVLSITGTYRWTGWGERIDLLETVAVVCFCLAATWPYGPSPTRASQAEGGFQARMLPFLPLVGGFAYLAGHFLINRPMDAPMVIAATVLIVLLCVRQYLVFKDLDRAQGELEYVNARLYSLNDAKNRIISVAAHDLRNPLSGVLLECEYGKESQNLEEAYASLGRIQDLGDRMHDILKRLLDVHAIEAGVAEMPACVNLDLVQAVKEAGRRHDTRAAAKSIRLSVKSSVHRAEAWADPHLVAQILDNYLGNALKYSPSGRAVELRLKKEGTQWLITVQDQGPGLTEEDLAHVFTPYARLSAKPTAGETSVGLGLSIARRLAESMGGEVGVESREGEGAAFWVALPKARPHT
ncbi:MAG: HAMP domain-containing histidine kinase, partial [Firmicutes bacterium]|nr:HAMP domain-containing histidine kinase [Bacillota bacterium]